MIFMKKATKKKKMKLKSEGFVFFLGNLKKKLSLVIGGFIFLCSIYYLSTYIWAVEVDVQQNIPPFEIRKQLNSIGIKPGIAKASIDVKEIEKQLENMSSEILWLRVRIEGSTLKVIVEEKINPPQEQSYEYGNLVATMEGEVKRVYTFAGRAKVKSGQLVKAGDVVIEGIDGNEGGEYILPPRGIVIANTFYEKSMNVKISGTQLERSGEKDSAERGGCRYRCICRERESGAISFRCITLKQRGKPCALVVR